MSLISRKLLTADEVLMIENPYALVMIAGKPPVIANIPDISKMHFNELLGMGTEEENQELRIIRENKREIHNISKPKIWDIWNKRKNEIDINNLEVIQRNLKGIREDDD